MKDAGENEIPTALDFELKDETAMQDENTVHPDLSDDCDNNLENVCEDMIFNL